MYRVEEDFLVFVRNKKIYDQLRFIGPDGMEMVRVDWNSGNPIALPRERLQDKSQRYYFLDTMRLGGAKFLFRHLISTLNRAR